MNAALYLSCEELLNIAKALKAVRVAREQLTPLTTANDGDFQFERIKFRARTCKSYELAAYYA